MTNKGNDKQEVADSLIHTKLVMPNVCIKLKNSRLCTFCKIIDEISIFITLE